MRELSLFSGAGGGIIGSKLLGWNTIGYVEWDDYCQQVIAQRIKDGIFDNAPIYGDIRAFIDSGRCELYRGITDVITAGFPCQPFSVAGKRKGADDERNMWPQTMDVIRRVKPAYCFLENVPGLLSATVDDPTGRSIHYFGEILRDLAEGGYDAKWAVLGADDVGAPHRRKRLWILATNTDHEGRIENGCAQGHTNGRANILPDEQERREMGRGDEGCCGELLGNTKGQSIDVSGFDATEHTRESKSKSGNSDQQANATKSDSQRGQRVGTQTIQGKSGLPWGENLRSIEDIKNRPDIPEPLLRRMDDGVADRSNRLKAVGNGQVPFTMAAAWKVLSEGVV